MDPENQRRTSNCAERHSNSSRCKESSRVRGGRNPAKQSRWTIFRHVSDISTMERRILTRSHSTQPAILTLLEIHRQCPEILSKLEIYVDSGIQRGTDILKALALGATAVGIGRPYLYALTHGQDSIEHLTESKSQTPTRLV